MKLPITNRAESLTNGYIASQTIVYDLLVLLGFQLLDFGQGGLQRFIQLNSVLIRFFSLC